MTASLHNPFVGPRPLSPADPIFGRDREIRELLYLLTAERIVLLYSPSGAGKSSLINARNGLLDRIRQRFDVWAPARVNLPPVFPVANRFAWSAAVGFEQEVPEDRRRGPEALAHLSLSEAVATRARKHHAPPSTALVFDQFEEVLRLDPLDIDTKREFFRQLGDLLHDTHVWALFVIREDYLAPLDSYCRLLPTHLQHRYRIDLLKAEPARLAMARTASSGGREFTEEAIEKLAGDLSQVKVQQPDGSFLTQAGPYVEPLQLQVACRGLWERMPEDDLRIDLEDVQRFGDVTRALSGYYADAVAGLSNGDIGYEWTIRDWMGEKLITADGIRGQVQRGAGESEGLANSAVQQLVDTHLVRAETRGGAVWYELAHDRLIQPIQQNNSERANGLDAVEHYNAVVARIASGDAAIERRIRAWIASLITAGGVRTRVQAHESALSFVRPLVQCQLVREVRRPGREAQYELAHDRWIEPIRKSNQDWIDRALSFVERRARLWEEDHGHPEGLLVVDAELRDALTWQSVNPDPLYPVTRYLDACKARQKMLDGERAARRARQWLLAAVALCALISAGLAVYAFNQKGAAEEKTRLAANRGLLAFREGLDKTDGRLSPTRALLTVELARRDPAGGHAPYLESLLAELPVFAKRIPFRGDAAAWGWDLAGAAVLAGGADGVVRRVDVSAGTVRDLYRHSGPVLALQGAAGGRVLSLSESEVVVYDLPAGREVSRKKTPRREEDQVEEAAFSALGNRLALATYFNFQTTIAVHGWQEEEKAWRLIGSNRHGSIDFGTLALSADGRWLASTVNDRKSLVAIFDTSQRSLPERLSSDVVGEVLSLRFSGNADELDAGLADGRLFIFEQWKERRDLRPAEDSPGFGVAGLVLRDSRGFTGRLPFGPGGGPASSVVRWSSTPDVPLLRFPVPPQNLRLHPQRDQAALIDGGALKIYNFFGRKPKSNGLADLAAEVCSRLEFNLSLSDWKRYAGELPYERTCPDLPPAPDPPTSTKQETQKQ